MAQVTAIGPRVGNGAAQLVEQSASWRVLVRITGTADLLFHRYDCESVEAKAKAAKGSKQKKTDDITTYVYRDAEGMLAIPGENLRQAVVTAAKSVSDPRSPRKSLMDLAKAAILCHTEMASLGQEHWDYEHRARVQVQRNAVSRVRPAMLKGWSAEFLFECLIPEHISTDMLHDLLVNAGRTVGVCDFRPTYGRFRVDHFELLAGD